MGDSKEPSFSPTGMKVLVCVLSFLNCLGAYAVYLYSVVILEAIVSYEDPHLSTQKMRAKVSFIKSLLATISPILAFFLVPTFGSLSDAYGRKKIIVIANAASVIISASYVVAYNFNFLPAIFIGQLFGFMTSVHISATSAYVSDLIADLPRNKKPLNFGLVGAATMMGVLVGSLLFGNMGNDKIMLILELGMILQISALVLAIVFMKDHPNRTKTAMKISRNPLRCLRIILKTKNKLLICLMVTQFISTLSSADILGTGYLYAQTRFNWTTSEYGDLTAAMSVGTVLSQVLFLGIISHFVREKHLVVFSFLYRAIIHVLLGLGSKGWMYVVVRLSEGPCFVADPSLSAILSIASPGDQVGAIMAAMVAVSSISSLIGSLVIENFFSYCLLFFPGVGSRFPSIYYIGNVFILCGLLSLINGLFTGVIFRKYFRAKKGATTTFAVTTEERPLLDEEGGDDETTRAGSIQ